MVLDAALAFLHFTFLLIMISAIGAEAFLLRLAPAPPVIKSLARADLFYGLSAAGLIAAGLCRVYFGLKGPDYYLASHAFWGKMAVFGLIGIVSIWPTIKFLSWSRAAKADAGFVPPPSELKTVRLCVIAEAHLYALVVLFAVMMARGLG